MIEIARVSTLGATNRREIIRRIMSTSRWFKNMTVATVAEALRYAEKHGLVYYGEGFLVVYHDCEN